MISLPADHSISDTSVFQQAIKTGVQVASETRGFVTLGIKPGRPHTGYGYIELGDKYAEGVHLAKRFYEKPSIERATHYTKTGNFFWNSGIFIWTLETIEKAFETFLPEEWKAIYGCKTFSSLTKAYSKLSSVSIDTGIMEKASPVYVIPTQMGWSDVGSWSALADLLHKDQNQNTVVGNLDNISLADTKNTLIQVSPDTKIAVLGVQDLVIIEKEGRILVTRKSADQLVRQAALDLD
jgi:mannose-1-phosphate guanylyltransferase